MPILAGSVRDIPVDAHTLCGLTWSGEFLWFSESVSHQIVALDPVSGEAGHRVPCPEVRTDLTTLDGNLVQVVGERQGLRVLDPVTGAVVSERSNPRAGHELRGLEATRWGIWFGYADLQVAELRDTVDLTLLETVRVRDPMAGLTASDHYVAYSNPLTATINLIDLEQGREVASYTVPGTPTGITWDGTRIWYCDVATVQIRAIEVLGILRR